MKRLLSLVPETTVVVRPEEKEEYLREVPENQLVILPDSVKNYVDTLQWCFDNFSERVLVNIDDDLVAVYCLIGNSCRTITDAAAIRQIIENSAQICLDLDIKAFGYCRNLRRGLFGDESNFIKFNFFMSSAWGVVGRPFRYSAELTAMSDIDNTLKVLADYRIIYSDGRFYFNHGLVCGGKGGLQKIRTTEKQDNDIKILKKRWGNLINITRKINTIWVSLNVPRKANVLF